MKPPRAAVATTSQTRRCPLGGEDGSSDDDCFGLDEWEQGVNRDDGEHDRVGRGRGGDEMGYEVRHRPIACQRASRAIRLVATSIPIRGGGRESGHPVTVPRVDRRTPLSYAAPKPDRGSGSADRRRSNLTSEHPACYSDKSRPRRAPADESDEDRHR
jgi:hypothetical protein